MRIGSIFFEAKLTETDFTSRTKARVFRYAALTSVFDVDRIPATSTTFQSYQLIRNVLGSAQHGATFVLLIDRRRPDLLKLWNDLTPAITDPAVAARCNLRFWQDVAAQSPRALAEFLEAKYGLCVEPET
jgi:hypothetical protein